MGSDEIMTNDDMTDRENIGGKKLRREAIERLDEWWEKDVGKAMMEGLREEKKKGLVKMRLDGLGTWGMMRGMDEGETGGRAGEW